MSKKSGFMQEFKKFILRGNVMDMAVGVIVGGAFTAIVTSLNQDILTPILAIFGGTDFSNYENNIHFPDQEALLQLADYFGVTVDYLLGRTSYRYSLDTLNEEYAPGMTVAELVNIIQHFSPLNTASFLDYIELLQLRQKAEDCSSTS